MKIAIISDDFTGANASGVLLSKQGLLTATVMQDTTIDTDKYDAVCVNTNSRYISPSQAYRRVANATVSLLGQGAELFSKRIDSTVRGNIGAEIDAVLDSVGNQSIAVVVPSFPESGRTTKDGYLLLNGKPVQETDVYRDPIAPLRTSYVPDIIAKQSNKSVARIEIGCVLKGTETIAKKLKERILNGARIIVIDATKVDQIKNIAEAMSGLNQKFITVDPGPLTSGYAVLNYGRKKCKENVVAAVASSTSTTVRQIEYLTHQWKISPVFVNPECLVSGHERRGREIKKAIDKGLERVGRNTVILVTTCRNSNSNLDLKSLAQEKGTSENALGMLITTGLAIISRKIIESNIESIKGFFLSGGDMTTSFCEIVGAKGIRLIDEVMPLAVQGEFIGGMLDEIPVITKGGLIGDETAISSCVQSLLTKRN